MAERDNQAKPSINPQPIHLLRVSGMILGSLPIIVVFSEQHVPQFYWVWCFFCSLIWPLIAFLKVKYSVNPILSERNNLILDTFLISSFVPLIQFNLLPSALALTLTMADKISSSARNVAWPSLLAGMLGILIFGLLFGFQFNIHSNTNVIIACLPLFFVHSLAISVTTHRLVRNIKNKNKKLKELSSKDFLTGLYNKRYWHQKVDVLIESSKENQTPLVLMLIDSDYFKQINDRFGHLAGDEVLCEIGQLLQNIQSVPCIAGRLGGDEFALLLEADDQNALQIAQAFTHQVRQIQLSSFPKLTCSVSVGLSAMNPSDDFKDLFSKADKALYKAKSEGRNRVCSATLEGLEGL